MKAILWLKRFDLAAQLGALCVPALLAIASGQYFGLFYIYFFVGGAQVISFIVHAIARRSSWTVTGRPRYGRLLLLAILLALGTLGLSYVWNDAGAFALCLGLVYLLATPLMAIWYFLICLRETEQVARVSEREMLIVRSV